MKTEMHQLEIFLDKAQVKTKRNLVKSKRVFFVIKLN